MISFLKFRSNRWTHDGWAVFIHGSTHPLAWTVCTTREEVRQLLKDRGDLFMHPHNIVKVKVKLEVVE